MHSTNTGARYFNIVIYPLVYGEEKFLVIRMDDITEQIIFEERLVQNDKMAFFLLEGLFGNLLLLSFNLVFYFFWGLQGLAISFVGMYLVYFIVIYFFTRFRYSYSMTKNVVKIFSIMLLLLSSTLITISLFNSIFGQTFCVILSLLSMFYAYLELDKLIDLKETVLNIRTRLNGKRNN